MADNRVFVLPTQVVGPVSRFQVFPRLSVTPLIVTVAPFHGVLVETNTTRVVAPVELNGDVV